jgi:hypothetical protein
MNRGLALGLGLMVLVVAARPADADGAVAPESPAQLAVGPPPAALTTVRTAVTLAPLGSILLGVEVSRLVSPHAAVEASVSYANFFYGSGLAGDLFVRALPFSGPGRLSLGLGVMVADASPFGVMEFGLGEVAYEYRRAGQISALFGLGAQVALTDTPKATCPEFFGCILETDQYRRGDLGLRLRIAFGFGL